MRSKSQSDRDYYLATPSDSGVAAINRSVQQAYCLHPGPLHLAKLDATTTVQALPRTMVLELCPVAVAEQSDKSPSTPSSSFCMPFPFQQ